MIPVTDHHHHHPASSEIDDTAAADDILKMMFPSSSSSFSSSKEQREEFVTVNPLLRIGVDCQDIYPIVQASDSLFFHHHHQQHSKTNRDHQSSSSSSNDEKAYYLLPYTLHEELQSKFQGQQDESKYILLVRILQVSVGSTSSTSNASSSKKKNFMTRIFGCSSSKKKKKIQPSNDDDNNNTAKLEICYCLCLRGKTNNEIAFIDRKTYTKKNTAITSSSLSDDLTTLCADGIQREIMNASRQHPIPQRRCSSKKRINPSPVANQPQRTLSSSSSSTTTTTTTSDVIYQYHQNQKKKNHRGRRISRINGMYCGSNEETAEEKAIQIQQQQQQQRISDLDERWSGELLKQQRQGQKLPTI